MTKYPVITIDGPSGTGKGTIGALLAKHLEWRFLDSGAIYRVLAFAAKQKGLTPDNTNELAELANKLPIEFATDFNNISMPQRVFYQSQDVTNEIRTQDIGNLASIFGAIPMVRQALLARQRAFQNGPPGLVTDGRDMGTVIFPDAELKIYLIASGEERAKRRFNQLMKQGINATLDAVLNEILERDERDKTRSSAPLRPADDAIIVDTTGLTIEAVFQKVLLEVDKRFATIC